jgi:integrase/recombinase XerD
MYNDTDDLIAQLCTRIGMIMEDTSVTALTAGSLEQHERLAAIDEVEMVAQRIDALVAAVRALLG